MVEIHCIATSDIINSTNHQLHSQSPTKTHNFWIFVIIILVHNFFDNINRINVQHIDTLMKAKFVILMTCMVQRSFNVNHVRAALTDAMREMISFHI